MQIEKDIYLEDYFGMARDILIQGNHATITFYAIMNDDVTFSFHSRYESNEKARKSLEAYMQNTKSLTKGLPYNTESIDRINESIKTFMRDVIFDAVELPNTQYEFAGDKGYLETLLQDETCKFLWHD